MLKRLSLRSLIIFSYQLTNINTIDGLFQFEKTNNRITIHPFSVFILSAMLKERSGHHIGIPGRHLHSILEYRYKQTHWVGIILIGHMHRYSQQVPNKSLGLSRISIKMWSSARVDVVDKQSKCFFLKKRFQIHWACFLRNSIKKRTYSRIDRIDHLGMHVIARCDV